MLKSAGRVFCALLFALCFSATGQTYLGPSNPPPSVTLAWDASAGTNEIAGYNIYYGTASRAYTVEISAGTALTCTISNLVRGSTYFFAATAVDAFGLESDYSDEVSCSFRNLPAAPVMRPIVILTVQARPSVAEGLWADSGMSWSLSPEEATQVFRLQVTTQ